MSTGVLPLPANMCSRKMSKGDTSTRIEVQLKLLSRTSLSFDCRSSVTSLKVCSGNRLRNGG